MSKTTDSTLFPTERYVATRIMHPWDMDTEALRSLIERHHTRRLWGQPHTVTPRLITEVFGDGAKLICLTPVATRPDYYVVRIDSKWDLDDEFRDHLDDIYDAIESEYGSTDDVGNGDEYFPVLNLSCGSSWGELDWPDRLSPSRREVAHA